MTRRGSPLQGVHLTPHGGAVDARPGRLRHPHGSTQGIAERIAERLRGDGLDAAARSAFPKSDFRDRPAIDAWAYAIAEELATDRMTPFAWSVPTPAA